MAAIELQRPRQRQETPSCPRPPLHPLAPQNLQSAAAAEAAAAAAAYQRKASGTPTRAHRRGASVDFQGGQSKEDLLDNIFSSYGGGLGLEALLWLVLCHCVVAGMSSTCGSRTRRA